MKFQLIDEGFNVVIKDTDNNLNFLFVAEGSMGVHIASRELAQRVVDFLNNLPDNQTRLR